MNRRSVRISTSTCILFLVAASVAADTHPFSVHDMLAMERIGELQGLLGCVETTRLGTRGLPVPR